MLVDKDLLNKGTRKPHIRIALTSKCNFKCVYCKDGGEGVVSNDDMSIDELKVVARIANEVGFSHIKFTGGEPLFREKVSHDFLPLIKYIRDELEYEDIQMVTNGFYIKEYATELSNIGLNSITISLDTADKLEFKKITGSNEFTKVVDGIQEMIRQGVPVIINTVYMKNNSRQIGQLIDLSLSLGSDIKILDCVDYPDSSIKNYQAMDDLYQYLESYYDGKYDFLLPPGGLGTPMRRYSMNGQDIIIKDAKVGTNYNSTTCFECKFYPCQDALISLRVTANGYLKRCMIRDDNLVDIRTSLKLGKIDEVKSKIQDAYEILMSSKYYEKAWNV